MPPLQHMKTSIEHLPERKQWEIKRICEILFEEFELAKGHGQKIFDKKGRILKIILFGSYARGGWVDEARKTAKGYQSDFDLLIVVNYRELTEMADYWYKAEDRIMRERRIETPVGLIVHSLAEVNDMLGRGQYFFTDIVRDGIALYELKGHRFVKPMPLNAEEAYEQAKDYFEDGIQRSKAAFKGVKFYLGEKEWKYAAFLLHQTVETLYATYLLTTTLYSPHTHNIKKLRGFAEAKDERFRIVWPGADRFQRRSFERLKDAYVKARYSKHYVITEDELQWLDERAQALADLVKMACEERLKELKKAAGE